MTELSFSYPLIELESDKIKLVQFQGLKNISHLEQFLESARDSPELFTYLPFGPMKSSEHFLSSFYYPRIRDDPHSCLFAILTKIPTINSHGASQPVGSLAGIIGLLNAQPHNAACELGYLLILPSFQRTFVTTHACGLLLQYLLQPTSKGGLGLRRVAWQAHWQNVRSIEAAKRLGFRLEGTIRWQRSYSMEKPALNVSSGRSGGEWEGVVGRVARHTVLLGLCWDDWEQGGEDHIRALMSR